MYLTFTSEKVECLLYGYFMHFFIEDGVNFILPIKLFRMALIKGD